MCTKYEDPENVAEELALLKTFPTLREVNDQLDKIFPKWIAGFIFSFTDDYVSMTENWNKICKELNVEKTHIMSISDDNMFAQNHSLSRAYADIFTRSGFHVRSQCHLAICSGCKLAIASKKYHKVVLATTKSDTPGQLIMPSIWNPFCSKCTPTETVEETVAETVEETVAETVEETVEETVAETVAETVVETESCL
jgi:hypothetical protein